MKKIIFISDENILKSKQIQKEKIFKNSIAITLFQTSDKTLSKINSSAVLKSYRAYINWEEELRLKDEGFRIFKKMSDKSIEFRNISLFDLYIPNYLYIINFLFLVELYERVLKIEKPSCFSSLENTEAIRILKDINRQKFRITWDDNFLNSAGNASRNQKIDKLFFLGKELMFEKRFRPIFDGFMDDLELKFPLLFNPLFSRNSNFNFSRQTKGKRIGVVVGYYKNYIKPLLPIIERLEQIGYEVILFAEGHSMKGFLKILKRRFFTVHDFNCSMNKKNIENVKKSILQWVKRMDNLPAGEEIRYHGVNIWELFKLIDGFSAVINNRFIKFHFTIEALNRFVKESELNLLLVGTDVSFFERIAVQIAKEQGVPTVHIQHGLIAHSTFANSIADKICVWGEGFKERLVELGIEPQKIAVTGRTNINDDLIVKSEQSKMKAKWKIPANGEVLTWVTAPVTKISFNLSHALLCEEIMENIASVLENQLNLFLIIKVHPLDKFRYFIPHIKGLKASIRKRIKIVKDVPLESILEITDALLLVQSTGLVEAIKKSIPTVKVAWVDVDGDIPFAKRNVFLEASKDVDLFMQFSKLFTDRGFYQQAKQVQKRYCSDFLSYNGTQALDRVIDVIESSKTQIQGIT